MPRAGAMGTDAVSPVIGTIMVLAITVIGIAALLVWGGPTIERVQGQNAAFAMQGEFEGLRDASQDLSVPDHSRFPSIVLPRGSLSLEPGTRFLVAAGHDPDVNYKDCDLHVTGWGGAATASVTVSASNCRALTVTNFEIFGVAGTTLSKKTVVLAGAGPYTATVTGADFSKGDWLFRITDGLLNPTVYAQAWMHTGDMLRWNLQSSVQSRDLYLEGGAIFSKQDDTVFLQKAPAIGDTASGSGYYGLWLRTFAATGTSGLDETGTHQVFFALANNDLHVDTDVARKMRFTFDGNLADAWCNAMVARNDQLTRASIGASYTADPSASCAAGDSQGLRSVTFSYSASAPFQLRFLHARIQTSLVS